MGVTIVLAEDNLIMREGIAHLVWTDIVDGRPQLHGAVLAR